MPLRTESKCLLIAEEYSLTSICPAPAIFTIKTVVAVNWIESFTTSYAVYSCNGDSWKVDYE